MDRSPRSSSACATPPPLLQNFSRNPLGSFGRDTPGNATFGRGQFTSAIRMNAMPSARGTARTHWSTARIAPTQNATIRITSAPVVANREVR